MPQPTPQKNPEAFASAVPGEFVEQFENLCSVCGQSEDLFPVIFQNAPILATVSCIEDGRYLAVNKLFCHLSGFTENEVLGKTSTEIGFISSEDRDRLLLLIRETGRISNHELTLYKKNKEPLTCLYYGVMIEFGGRKRLLSMAVDISDRKQIEKKLLESQEKYSSLFNNRHTSMLVIDPENSHILEANPAACEYYGYLPEEFRQLKITDLNILPAQEVFQRMRVAKERKQTSFCFQHRLKNGEIREVEIFSGPIRYGEKIVLCSFIHDISKRVSAEKQLLRAKEEWEKSFNAIHDIITIQDKDMRIVRVNQAACRFLGKSENEILHRFCYEMFACKTHPCRDCPVVKTTTDGHNHTVTIHNKKNGRVFQVSSSPIVNNINEIELIVHVAKDITDQVRLEEELFQAQKMEAIGTLAGGIAHDFNNILTGILGFAELTREGIVSGTHPITHIEQVIKAGNRARDLVKQILTFSRKGKHQVAPIEPYLIVKESLKLLAASLPKTIEVKAHINANTGYILADPTKIQQILVNLCTNALHAMPHEKGILTVSLAKVQLTGQSMPGSTEGLKGPFVQLEVSDTGVGIEPENLQRIFEPYFTTKEVGKGTGMGLAMVHSIVQDFGGSIKVRSQPGVGSTFSVYFPVYEVIEHADQSIPEDTPIQGGNEHILLAEDEPMIAQMLQALLENNGYRVSRAKNGLEAYELLRKNPDDYDVLLTDQTMPVMTGSELAKQALGLRPNLPIVLCTGYSNVIDESKSKNIGIRSFLMKPVSKHQLLMELHRTLH